MARAEPGFGGGALAAGVPTDEAGNGLMVPRDVDSAARGRADAQELATVAGSPEPDTATVANDAGESVCRIGAEIGVGDRGL